MPPGPDHNLRLCTVLKSSTTDSQILFRINSLLQRNRIGSSIKPSLARNPAMPVPTPAA